MKTCSHSSKTSTSFVSRTELATFALQEELYRHARISIHLGKTEVWNSGEACATLQVATMNVDPTATVWRGDPTLPVALQGVKILGTPVGHEAFIVAQFG